MMHGPNERGKDGPKVYSIELGGDHITYSSALELWVQVAITTYDPAVVKPCGNPA